jgi:hypothetical protein
MVGEDGSQQTRRGFAACTGIKRTSFVPVSNGYPLSFQVFISKFG